MKYCSHCGQQIDDDAVFCIHCGCKVTGAFEEEKPAKDTLGTVSKVFLVLSCVAAAIIAVAFAVCAILNAVNPNSVNTFFVSFEFFLLLLFPYVLWADVPIATARIIIYAVVGGVLLISLVVSIILTVYVFRRINQGRPISTGARVCILLFVNVIAGILLLCRKEPNR